jgi:hypothetical protein
MKKRAFLLLALPSILIGMAAIAACGSREANSIVGMGVTMGRLLTGGAAQIGCNRSAQAL